MRYVSAILVALLALPLVHAEPLPGTQPLTLEGDIAAQMVAGIDNYLMRELAASVEKRQRFWKIDRSSPEAYDRSVQPNRERLKEILGVVDPRVPFTSPELVGTVGAPALVAECDQYKVYAVRWPVLAGLDGEGLLLEPRDKPKCCVVAVPDADAAPEMLVFGKAGVTAPGGKYAGQLAAQGCRVIIPVLIDRQDTWSGSTRLNRMTNQPHREFLYRMSYEMGRHLLGYEVQKVLAAVDWFERSADKTPIAVVGHGEGGLVALLATAVDPRITVTVAAGCFGLWENVWDQPIYRNVWKLLQEFGAAEVASLQTARGQLVIEASPWPAVSGPPTPRPGRSGAAPGRLVTPEFAAVQQEFKRLNQLGYPSERRLIQPTGKQGPSWLGAILGHGEKIKATELLLLPSSTSHDPVQRQKRQFDQLVELCQKVMRESEFRREATFWQKLDTSTPEKYAASCKPLREQFAAVLGVLPPPSLPMNPHTRQIFDEPKWKGYEVTLDVHPDVFAYGYLLVPKDLKPGEKRPVVVCQHGLEGRPSDVVDPKKRTPYYNSFGSTLADKGYIIYAPQNPYIGHDHFRVLQRKANPLGLALFSFIVRQHERTLDWLATLPYVDADKMAFYGLSYGGKTATRVPALVERYCLSICSGDFNEWTWKNVSLEFRGCYPFTMEYEMPEFNMGHTMVYAEQAALIAPRPFMVERGHDDGVGIDEWVAYEYAKVRRHYSRLKLPERTEIEWFAGGHEINGQGTYRFLQKQLSWPPK